METNSADVVAWLQHRDKVDKDGMLLLQKDDESVVTVQAKLCGNVLGYWEGHKAFDSTLSSEHVCGCALLERCVIELCNPTAELPYAFSVMFSGKCTLQLSAFSEDDREDWVKCISTAALEMKLAELNVQTPGLPFIPSTSPSGPFLNCSHQTFSFSHIQCHESMFESRLTFTLPQQFLSHIQRCTDARIELLLKSLIYLPKKYQEMKMEHISHLRTRVKFIKEALNAIDAQTDFFKKSVQKDDDSLTFCPTNLHLQKLTIHDAQSENTNYTFVTSGAASAFSSGYNDGGLLRLLQDFSSDLSSEQIDCFDETKLTPRLATIESIHKEVGALRFQLNALDISDRTLDKLDRSLNQLEDYKERCFQFVAHVPRVESTILTLKNLSMSSSGTQTETESRKEDEDFVLVPEQLQTQVTELEAYFSSFSSKLTAMRALSGTPDCEWISSAKNAALHVCQYVQTLLLSIRDALIYDMIMILRNRTSKHYQLQLREYICLSQALALATSAILSKLSFNQVALPAEVNLWSVLGPSICVLSHLSCIGQEQGMLEDQIVAWQKLSTQCSFRLVCPFSSLVPSSCIPIVEGDLTKFIVSLPVLENIFKLLPDRLRNGGMFGVHGIVWNMGLNHEAFLSSVTGSCVLEKEANQIALSQTQKYIQMLKTILEDLKSDSNICPMLFNRASSLYISLCETLKKGPLEKNMRVLWMASDWCRTVGGIRLFCCKSGKDRTGMAATLEEAQLLRRNHGLPETQMQGVLDELRRKGVRRDNCRKNIGVPCYAFSTLQVKFFLPTLYQPPSGTYRENYLT